MKEPTMISKMRRGRCGKTMAGMGVLLFALILVASQAPAMVLDTGNPDLNVRFDNTLTYSTATRIANQNETNLASPDADDAERNFDRGMIMNRVDLLTEFDMVYNRKFGVRVSANGWYDYVYNTENDNDSPMTVNHFSAPYNEFTDETQKWHGKNAELLDAFTWGAFDLGDMTLRYRAGQFGQQWGKAFFPPFGANSISGAFAPINIGRATIFPNLLLKEVLMQVPQATVGLQITDDVELGVLYQFQWEPNRLFAAGSYMSPADFIGPLGAELGPAMSARLDNVEAKDDGQFGVQLKYISPWNLDFEFYFANVHSRDFYLIPVINMATPPGAPPEVVVPLPTEYYFLYPEDIKYYAMSVDTTVGIYPLSVEVTYRTNAPLAGSPAVLGFLGMPTVDNDDDPIYPVGKTLHVDISNFNGGMVGRYICDKFDLIIELGIDHLLSVDENEEMLMENTKDTAFSTQVVYEPNWYQVYPGWDLSVPVEIAYSFQGKAAGMIGGNYGNDKGGSVSIGLKAWYNAVWKMGVTYKNFFGDAGSLPWNQPWTDRDFLSFYITRTF